MIYMDEPHGRLEWDATAKILTIQWIGFYTSAIFRKDAQLVLTVIKEQKATRLVANLTESKLISIEDQNFVINQWTPLAIEYGLKYIAYIFPKNVLTQMSVNRVVSRTSGLEIRYFQTEVEARHWLTGSDQ